MVSWGKAILTSLICVAWCFLWIFIGGIIIIYALYTPVTNSSQVPSRYFAVIIGLVIIGLPFNTAYFKFFPEAVNKADIRWGEAFSGSASYFGQAVGWGLFFILLPIGAVVGAIGIRASYYQEFCKMINGEEIEGKSAWRASGHMFGWVLLWALVAGLIIGFTTTYIQRNSLGYYNELALLIIALISAVFLIILGISAAEFKELGDIITFQETTWEIAYHKAALYAVWCILWLVISGAVIYLGFYTAMDSPDPLYRNYVYPITYLAIGLFILSWGCLSAYTKYLGDIIELW
ncbi:MAG: hypothetical protein ACFFCM_00595 [Promethearchaeota archaeon]